MLQNINSSFKKFGGHKIPNLIDYLKEKLEQDPQLTISIGCDSKNMRSKTAYAVTVVLYNHFLKNGAHVIFNRIYFDKFVDTFTRLYNEAEMMNELGNFIHANLFDFKRNDLDIDSRKKYKFHLQQYNGKFQDLNPIDEYNVINSTFLTDDELNAEYKICDVHLDYNICDGNGKNRSYALTKSTVPWLRSQGFRTFIKDKSFAASSAADLLLKR